VRATTGSEAYNRMD